MSTITYTVLDAEFDAGALAQGPEVRTRFIDLKTFLESNLLDATNNIKVTSAYPWTGTHSWTVTSAGVDNNALVVGAVMTAGFYGSHISSSVAQINSALQYIELTNASSTVPCSQVANAGTGSGYKAVHSATGSAFEGSCSSVANTAGVTKLTQAGTGPVIDVTLRTLTGLNASLLAKKITTLTSVDNTATETAISDLVVTLPADFLKAGTTIRGSVWGTIDTPGAGVPTARLKLYYGGTSGTVLLDSGAVTHSISLAGSLVEIKFILTCLTVGASGTIEAQGMVNWGSNTVPAARGLGTGATGAANTAAITIDTTLSKDLTLAFKWASAVSGATFKARSGVVEILT